MLYIVIVICAQRELLHWLCRPIARHETEKKLSALRYVRIETAIALVCSFLINLFIVSVFARVSTPSDTSMLLAIKSIQNLHAMPCHTLMLPCAATDMTSALVLA